LLLPIPPGLANTLYRVTAQGEKIERRIEMKKKSRKYLSFGLLIVILLVTCLEPINEVKAQAMLTVNTDVYSNVYANVYTTVYYKVYTLPPVKKLPLVNKKVYAKPPPSGVIIKTTQYGTSGKGVPLLVTSFEVPNPTKVVLLNCDLHGGSEDSHPKDGQELVNIGKATITYFTNNPGDLRRTTLYVVYSSNPDGLALGRRGNAQGVDLNRDFDYYWVKRTNARNKTLAPFSAPESRALRDLVFTIKRIHPKIGLTDLVDVHGFTKETFGSPDLCKPFNTAFGIKRKSGLVGTTGYFAGWAIKHAKRTVLLELPTNASSAKMISAVKAVCQK
jgi:hypothetical protein